MLLGLKTFLEDRENRAVKHLVESTFTGLRLARPQAIHRVEAFGTLNHVFRDWDVRLPDGFEMKLVLWPQRIARAPFGTNLDLWREVCEEFKRRHDAILR